MTAQHRAEGTRTTAREHAGATGDPVRVEGPWAASESVASVDPGRVLLERMAEGDRDALHSLYELTIAPAWRLALSATGDADRAELVVREAYARVWRSAAAHLRAGTTRLSPTAWVCHQVVEAAR